MNKETTILHIIAQKPYATGSGVFMTEIINSFHKQGIKNIALYGIDNTENKYFDENIAKNYEVKFNTQMLDFNILGMSDEMPYVSTKYSDLTEENLIKFKNEFSKKILDVVNEYDIDYVLCHHLYLLTAIVRDILPNKKVYGICHGTDLRQYKKTDLERDYIKNNIQKLDKVFCITEATRDETIKLFDVDEKKVDICSTGINTDIFYDMKLKKEENKFTFIYAGKVSKKKGVDVLVKAFNKLHLYKDSLKLSINNIYLEIAGSAGNKEEYEEILDCAKDNKNIIFLGALKQKDLALNYNKANAFIIASLSEAVPLVAIEALSCGLKVITSDILGVEEYFNKHTKDAYIDYITLPKLTNVDCATDEELSLYEDRVVDSMCKCINDDKKYEPKLFDISFDDVARKIFDKIIDKK